MTNGLSTSKPRAAERIDREGGYLWPGSQGGKERKGTLRRFELGPTWPRSLPRRRWIGKKRNVCHEIRRFRAEVAEFFLNKKTDQVESIFET